MCKRDHNQGIKRIKQKFCTRILRVVKLPKTIPERRVVDKNWVRIWEENLWEIYPSDPIHVRPKIKR
jgi:hypothetical protein